MTLQSENMFRDAIPEAIAGALGTDETGRLVAHLSDCPECRRSIPEASALIASAVVAGAPEKEPPPDLRARLMKRVRETRQLPASVLLDRDGIRIVRSAALDWQETGIPGVRWRGLASGSYTDRQMALFRMDAGAEVPAHRHGGIEELFMLSGTLLVEGVKVGAGDYCRGESKSIHGTVVAYTDAEFLMCSAEIQFSIEDL